MNSSEFRNKMKTMKDDYDDIKIPQELEMTIKRVVEDFKKEEMRNNKMKKNIKNVMVTAAAVAIVFTGAVNISPAFAESMTDIPVIGNIVRVINLNQYKYDEGTYNADLQTPIIEGLEDTDLQKSLNSKYIQENRMLFEQFEKEVAQMEEFSEGGHLGIDTGFEIKTDNEQILSIGRYVVNTVGSSSTTFRYDTVDKKNDIIITLPSLFKDEKYTEVISSNIKEQMKKQMKEDENKAYWLARETEIMGDEGFEKIDKDQQFYINEDSKLVISFDKYEVAPGYMGVIEFVIPTEKIQEILAGNLYIR
ncbi:DUF3298 domain-containing protein [Proteocatella sphenisci]|uniref:DUF3298 domain-containing protein n=1 Tax=Proteocatella sphenisci TaxID=181070 RepID=UPI00048ABF3E|nr:DUF3298 domain-containing protein [Proteocatella sphenisci]